MLSKENKAVLLEALASLPGAASIVVFGSCASGVESPGDIDVALVTQCADWNDVRKQHKETIKGLRALAYVHYGLLDPFIVTQGPLIVRNDEATGWMYARNSAGIEKAIARDGVKLLDLVAGIKLMALPGPDWSEL